MSKHRVSLFGRGLLVAAAVFGSLSAEAQEMGFSKGLKVRTAWSPSSKDQLANSMLGFGLNFGYGTAFGEFGIELGYSQKGGDAFQKPITGTLPSGLSPYDDGVTDNIPDPHNPGSMLEPTQHTPAIGDSRRNSLDGFSVRVSLARNLNEDWRWQAGLMFGGTRFKHEYVGDVSSKNWNGANATSWRDFYNGTPTEGGLSVSPYVGVSYRISSRSSLEFNALLLNYKSLDYIHRPGTGSYGTASGDALTPGRSDTANLFVQDTLEKKTRLMPHLEISYVFHF